MLHNDSLVFSLEPLDRVILGDFVMRTDSSWADLPSGDSVSRADEYNIKIHAKNTGCRIVLKTQINVLSNTESKASGVRKVLLFQFVFLYLKPTIKNLISLEASYL